MSIGLNACTQTLVACADTTAVLFAASLLGIEVTESHTEKFADGEILVKVEDNVRGADVFIVQSTSHPVNESIIELLLLIRYAPVPLKLHSY